MADDIVQQLQTFCEAHQVRRLEADEIHELLADGEDPAWIAGQAAGDRVEVVATLTELLRELAPRVSPPVQDEGPPCDTEAAVAGASVGHGPQPSPAAPPDAADLQAQLAALGGQLPAGLDARQLQQVLSSPRGQMLADFGAFCDEHGYDGADEEAMRAAHDEWLQTPRQALEGKRPAEVLEGGRLLPEKVETYRREAPKVGRNDPCPCGSGKKYKRCHGR